MKIFAFLAVALTAFAQAPLPEGEGKKTVEKLCLDCHGTDQIVALKLNKDGWEKVVNDMIEKGAEGTEKEFDQIVAYLTKNFGKDKQR